MYKILFLGPYSPPITGQCMAFRVVVDSYDPSDYMLIDTTKYNSRILSTLYVIASGLYSLLFDKKIRVVYITTSRTLLGSLKDVPILLLARARRLKVVNHLHGADFRRFYNESKGGYKYLLKKAYQGVSDSIVLTPSMANEYDCFDHMRIHVVPNFYPKDFDRPDRIKKDRLVVSYFSNLMKTKGIMEFLQAAKMVLERGAPVSFELAGGYLSDHEASKELIQMQVEDFLEENVSLNILYKGRIDPSARFEFLSNSSIFVLPTYYPTEGFPLSVIEAMRCGNAVVATNHNYLPELLTEANGILVETKDVNGLAKALLELIRDRGRLKRIQEFNIQEAINSYSQDKYLSRIKSLLKFSQ